MSPDVQPDDPATTPVAGPAEASTDRPPATAVDAADDHGAVDEDMGDEDMGDEAAVDEDAVDEAAVDENTVDEDTTAAVEPVVDPTFRTGMIAIVGRPNVGKSTLLNRFVGQKISITSRKAQTTRHRILGIATTDRAQFVFVDTPGFQTRHRSALHRTMNRAIRDAVAGVSAVLFVVEAGRFGAEDEAVLPMLPTDLPVILVINKADGLADKKALLPFIGTIADQHPWAAIVPVSAKTGLQIEALEAEIEKLLPFAPPLFDADDLTDRSERFLVAELVREKVFRQLGDELPYGMTVVIDRFVEEPSRKDGVDTRFCRIAATIVVERASHKAMLIGANGGKLKLIGTEARGDIEKLLQARCFLELFVKVRSGWADSAALVKSYGYD